MPEPIYDAECGCCMKPETREKYEAELKSTHNTREDFAKLAHSVKYRIEQQKTPNEEGANKALQILIETHHQELQKAREEERMGILKIALTMGDCPINSPEADAGWMKFQHDFCIKLTKDNKKSILSENDQSELDQPTV